MIYAFIYRKDTSYAEWEILLSKCREGTDSNSTTIQYCVRDSSFKCSYAEFYETNMWVRARSYQQFMELILDHTLTN